MITTDEWHSGAVYRMYAGRSRDDYLGETRNCLEAEAAVHAERQWIRYRPWVSVAWLPLGTFPVADETHPELEHARDIPDLEFLEAMCSVMDRRDLWVLGANRWDIAAELETRGFCSAPMYSGREQEVVPQKLVLAKARRLIKRGLIDGCLCGCRGDFELTAAGVARLGHGREAFWWLK